MTPNEINKTRQPSVLLYYSPGKKVYENPGYNALEIAVKASNLEIVSLLLQNGADPNLKRPIWPAGNKIPHSELFEFNNYKRKAMDTPMALAIRQTESNPEILSLLIQHGGGVSNPIYELHKAILQNIPSHWYDEEYNVFQYINKNSKQNTMIEPVIQGLLNRTNSDLPITDEIIELFKKFSKGNLLGNAIQNGTNEEFYTLLQYGMPLTSIKIPNHEVSDKTAEKINYLVDHDLISQGSIIGLCKNNPKKYPAHIYAIWLNQNSAAIDLIESKTTAQLNNGRTPKQEVRTADDPMNGYDSHDNPGFNALEMAVKSNNLEIIPYLLSKGMDPNLSVKVAKVDNGYLTFYQRSPLSLAQEIGNKEILDALKNTGPAR
jgi:ankyrin repeat protein